MDERCECASGQRVRVVLSITPNIIEQKSPTMNIQAIFSELPVVASPSINLYSTFSWLEEFHKTCQASVDCVSIESLKNLVNEFISLVGPEASNCLTKPFRSVKLKKCFVETITYFHFLYQDVKESMDHTLYLDKMTSLLAMYLDAEIQAYISLKESLKKVSSRITTILVLALDNSQDHILDALLKCQSILKPYNQLCLVILSKILSDIQPKPHSELQYIRLLLAFKRWKILASDTEEKLRINKLASDRLPCPRTLLENPPTLAAILPSIPKKKQRNATLFLMIAKFNVIDAIQAFLRVTRERPHSFSKIVHFSFTFKGSSFFDFITEENIPLLKAIWSSLSFASLNKISIIEKVPRRSRLVPPTISAKTTSSTVATAPVSRFAADESRKRVHSKESNSKYFQKKRKDDSPNNETEASQSEIINVSKPMECDITPNESKQNIPRPCHDISSDIVPKSSLPIPQTLQSKDLSVSTCLKNDEKHDQMQSKDLPKSTCIKNVKKHHQIQSKDLPEGEFAQTVSEQCSLSSNSKIYLLQPKPTRDPYCTIGTDEFECSSTEKSNIAVAMTENEPKSAEVPLLSHVENDLRSSIMKSSGADSVSSSTPLKDKEDQKSPSETDMQSEPCEDEIDLTEYGFIQIPLNLYNCLSQAEQHMETNADYFTIATSYDKLLISQKSDYNVPYYEFDSQISMDDKDLNQEMFIECKDIENVAIPLLASFKGEPRNIEITPFDMKEDCSSSHYIANTEMGYTGLFTRCGLESSVDNNVPETKHKSSSNLSTLIHEIDSTVSTEVEPLLDISQLSTSARKQVELSEDSSEQSEKDVCAMSDSTIPACKGTSKIVFPEYVLCYAIKHKLLYPKSQPYCRENVKMLRIIFSGFSKSPSHKFIYFYRKHLQDSDKDETVVQVKSLCENIDASSSCINEISSTSQKSKPIPDSPMTSKPPSMNSEVVPCESSAEVAISQKPVSNLFQTSDSCPTLTVASTNPKSNTKTLKLPASNCSTTDCDVSKPLIPMSTLPSDQTALKSTVPMSSSSVKPLVLPNPEIPKATPKPTAHRPQLEIILNIPIDTPNSKIPTSPSKTTYVPCPQLPISAPPVLPAPVKYHKIPKTVYSHPTIVPNPQMSNYSAMPTTFSDPQDLSSSKPNVSFLEIPMAAYSPKPTTVPSTQIPKVVSSLNSDSKSSPTPRSVYLKPTPITNVSSKVNDSSDPQMPIDLSIETTTLSSPQNSKPNTVAKSQMPVTASNETHVRTVQNPKALFSPESNLLHKYLITNVNPPPKPSPVPSTLQIPLDVSSKFIAPFNPQMPIDASRELLFFSNSQIPKLTAVSTSQMPMTASPKPNPQGSRIRSPRTPNTVTNHRKSQGMSSKPNTASNHQIPGAISFPTAISTFQVPIAASYKQSHVPHTEIPIATSFKQNLPPYPQVQIPALKKRCVAKPKSSNKRSADSNSHLLFTPKSSASYPSSVKPLHPSQHSVISHTSMLHSSNQSCVLPQSVPMSTFSYQPPAMSNISGGYQIPFRTTSIPHSAQVPVTTHIEPHREVPRIMNHMGFPTNPIPPPVPYHNINNLSIHPSTGDDDLRKKVEETIKTLENEIVPDKQNALPLKKRKQADENQTELRLNVREPVTTLLDSYPSTLMYSIAECVSGLERRKTSAARSHLNPAQVLAEITSRHVMARPPVLAASSAPSSHVAPARREPTFPYTHSSAPTSSQISGTYQSNLVPISRAPFEIQNSPGSQIQVALQNQRPEHTVSNNRTRIWRPVDLSMETASFSNTKMNNK